MANQDFFSGLNTIEVPTDIKDTDTPDTKNSNISEPGALSTRPGTSKDNSSAHATPPIYHIFELVTGDDVTKDMYIDNSGNLVTF
jgi:hypothetical protein